MATFRAILLFPGDAGEGRYEFEAPSEFIENAPARIVDSFLNTIQGLTVPGEIIDAEINAAHNYRDIRTVTASGSLILKGGGAVPFLVMISENRDAVL
ncbi:MAG: hypothetical protein R3D02_09010 [Hyphomicrobiales bacterium]